MIINIISALLIFTGVLTIIYDIIMSGVMNFNLGIVFVAGFGLVVILIGVFLKKILTIKWLKSVIVICFVLLFALIAFIYSYGRNNDVDYKEDAVIVLGCGLKGDQVRGQLKLRLDTAVEYNRKNPNAIIVVSGGQGKDETVTEAFAMEQYLIENGVPEDSIVKEETSVSTETNLINSKVILDEMFGEDYTIALITNDFHIYRAQRYAKSIGYDCHHVYAPGRLDNLPMNALRECAAVLKAWVFD